MPVLGDATPTEAWMPAPIRAEVTRSLSTDGSPSASPWLRKFSTESDYRSIYLGGRAEADLGHKDPESAAVKLTALALVPMIMLPIIILYTSWVYRIMRGKVTQEHIRDNEHSAY